MGKKAVCSVVNKGYLDYLEVFSYSLIKHNPKFNRDYIVFYKENDLDASDFKRLRKIYKNFIFKKINVDNYKNINWTGTKNKDTSHVRKIGEWTYYRLEMFNLKNYDQVVWFDIDMLVLNNLDNLFSLNEDNHILACEDILVKTIKPKDDYERDHKVQGGLIVIGKNLINEKVYSDLISLLSYAYKYEMNDQSMFVEYFGKTGRLINISPLYNLGRKLVARGKYKIENVSIIHYPGSKKPKDLKTNTYRSDCPTFSLWHKIEKEIKGN